MPLFLTSEKHPDLLQGNALETLKGGKKETWKEGEILSDGQVHTPKVGTPALCPLLPQGYGCSESFYAFYAS